MDKDKIYWCSHQRLLKYIWPFRGRQKGESQNRGNERKKARKTNISDEQISISYPLIYTPSTFFGKFGVLCFLVTSVLKFAFLPYYRRIVIFCFSWVCFLSTLLPISNHILFKLVIKKLWKEISKLLWSSYLVRMQNFPKNLKLTDDTFCKILRT